MNLLFRLLRVILAARFLPKVGLLDETVISFRVWPTDLDPLWHMNNGKYCSLMDLGRLDMMACNGVISLLRERGWYPVIAAEWIRFKTSLTPFARFELRTRTIGWDEKSFYVRQTFLVRDRVVAVGLVRARFLAKSGGSVDAPALVACLAPTIQPPPLPDYVRDWQAAENHLVE